MFLLGPDLFHPTQSSAVQDSRYPVLYDKIPFTRPCAIVTPVTQDHFYSINVSRYDTISCNAMQYVGVHRLSQDAILI